MAQELVCNTKWKDHAGKKSLPEAQEESGIEKEHQ